MMKENIDIATALSEWTYYFLISYQDSSPPNDDTREQEILDIFEIKNGGCHFQMSLVGHAMESRQNKLQAEVLLCCFLVHCFTCGCS